MQQTIFKIFLFIPFIGFISCTSSNNQTLEEEITSYLSEFYPGYELFPDDFPKPNLTNKINAFENSLINLEETSKPHLQAYDFNGDGYDDYYLEIYSLSYDPPPNSDQYTYLTSTLLILGSENGLATNSFEFESTELSTSGDFYHLLDRRAYILKSGFYSFPENIWDSINIEQNSLIVYEGETVGILEWKGDSLFTYLLINN